METTIVDLINATRYFWLPVALGLVVWAIVREIRDFYAMIRADLGIED